MTRLAFGILAFGCSPTEPGGGDAAREGGDAARDAPLSEGGDATRGEDGGEDSDGALDGDAEPRPGPATFVVTHFSLSVERACDFDGDGIGDNALADLGPTHASVFAAAVAGLVQGTIDTGERFVVHFPWLDDLVAPDDPETIVLLYEGADLDDPWDGSDDFSGNEPLAAKANALDACGEPLSFFMETSVDGGVVDARSGSCLLPLGVVTVLAGGAHCWGEIEPGSRAGTFSCCGYVPLADLGPEEAPEAFGGLTALEALTAGGAVLGLSGVPGLAPDVDLDGDGLERIVVDGDGHVSRCIDGDLSEIPGSDCWQDARMADAFSNTMVLETTSADFGGRAPDWETDVEGTCAEGPPEESLWDYR